MIAKTKQKTMRVDSFPSDSSDPEAVSGSSTKFDLKNRPAAKSGLFCCFFAIFFSKDIRPVTARKTGLMCRVLCGVILAKCLFLASE